MLKENMFGLGLPELIIILVVVVIFFAGGEKVAEIARGLGRATGEFKKGKEDIEKEIGGKDKLSEITRGLGRFTREIEKGTAEVGKVINEKREEWKSVKIPINKKM